MTAGCERGGKGVRGVREEEEEMEGAGSSTRVGSGRNREKLLNNA